MKDLARKAVLVGLGLGVATKEKAERVAKELLKKGEANEGDVRKLAVSILEESRKQERRLKAMLDSETKKAVSMALARSESELNKLKSKLHAMQGHKKPAKKHKKRKR